MIQTKQRYSNAIVGKDQNVLQDIHLRSKNIAIYQRNIDHLNKDLEQIINQKIECRASGTTEVVSSKLQAYFSQNLPEHSDLLKDIFLLVKLFEKTTKASSLRLLLATVSTNMCRKFHTDINDLRLLCTYVGPGTNWIPDEIVDELDPKSRLGDLESIIKNQHIQKVPTGDVVILKGALYEEANPILHRSPPIEEYGEKRLLLRLDTNASSNLFM